MKAIIFCAALTLVIIGSLIFPAIAVGEAGVVELEGSESCEVTAFSDDFEGSVAPCSRWDEACMDQWHGGNWWCARDQSHSPSRSAKADHNHDDILHTDSIDLSDAISATLEFNYMHFGTDSDDFTLYFYDGTEGEFPAGWNIIAELGRQGADLQWHHYSTTIDITTYGISDFKVGFDADLGWVFPFISELAWIDDVVVTKQVSEYASSFSDDFEVSEAPCSRWDADCMNQWNGGDWWCAKDQSHSPGQSAKADFNHDDILYTDPIDLSGVTGATVEFWYRHFGTDSDDFTLYFYDGTEGEFPTGWNVIDELGRLGADNRWHFYHTTIKDTDTYCVPDFRVGFDADMGWVFPFISELAWIDDVVITPPLEGTVFEDSDGDGMRDEGEPGISDIVVSNGVDVTVTDSTGAYTLLKDGYFIFITVPSDYTPTTPWYRSVEGDEFDFGLEYTPEKATEEFTFVQITDIHIDSIPERISLFQQDVAEINDIDPPFVIDTGDLVSRGDEVSIAQANEWFEVYADVTSDFNMPLYTAVGNHELVGTNNPDVDPSEPGYNKEMYRDYFGPTYYSFDWGGYHCIVLDANQFEDGRRFYGVEDQQLEWLEQDLAQRQGKPILVFYHEQTPLWEENRYEVWDMLTAHGEMTAFLGHLHHDILMMDSYNQGVPEQVTGALCGQWFCGPNIDGVPRGYRIISVDADGVSSFYKHSGTETQINITSPDEIVSGAVTLTAQVYTEYGPVTGVSYRVDDSGLIPMSLEAGGLWDTATATWDTTLLEPGYHTVTVEATDAVAGNFSTEKSFKIAVEDAIPLGELFDHYGTFLGKYTNVTGNLTLVIPYGGGGGGTVTNTAYIVDDGDGIAVIIAQACVSPPLPELFAGDTISARVVPVMYTWELISEGGRILPGGWLGDLLIGIMEGAPWLVELFLPDFLVTDEDGNPIEIRLLTLLSAADIEAL
ncbi:MAG TPA: hypothetical protein G4O13_02135 [Dehalococcoidia bacterium]|nr:hypothetical protein [Dehalococcoidia bacterium]